MQTLKLKEDLNLESNSMQNLFSSKSEFTQKVDLLHKFPFRIFYFLFVPKVFRIKIKKKSNILQKQHVSVCWRLFLENYFSGRLENFKLSPKKKLNNKKIIWQYWGQGLEKSELPKVVDLCFASVDRYKEDYEIIRLDEKSIQDYIDLPSFIWDKKENYQFKHAFFADLLRLALLDIYGGIWLDATILLTAPISENISKQNFFMFQRSPDAMNKEFWINFNDDYFNWSPEHNVNVLNSFIVAEKENILIHTCLDILLNFWKTQENIPHYFFFQIMFHELTTIYFPSEKGFVIDDTLPHVLVSKISEDYNEFEYKDILNKTHIHKLNYNIKNNKGSYYSFLEKDLLLK